MPQWKYEDIVELPHYRSERRLPMSLQDRAAQFAPFAALTGFDGVIAETGRLTDRRAELDETEKAQIDAVLQQLWQAQDTQPEIAAMVFRPDTKKSGGAYVQVVGRLRRIDPQTGSLWLADGSRIPIEDLYGLEIRQP